MRPDDKNKDAEVRARVTHEMRDDLLKAFPKKTISQIIVDLITKAIDKDGEAKKDYLVPEIGMVSFVPDLLSYDFTHAISKSPFFCLHTNMPYVFWQNQKRVMPHYDGLHFFVLPAHLPTSEVDFASTLLLQKRPPIHAVQADTSHMPSFALLTMRYLFASADYLGDGLIVPGFIWEFQDGIYNHYWDVRTDFNDLLSGKLTHFHDTPPSAPEDTEQK